MSFDGLYIVMATKETSLQLQRIQKENEQYISCAVVSDQSHPLYINLDRADSKIWTFVYKFWYCIAKTSKI